jgi:hypothetical protein
MPSLRGDSKYFDLIVGLAGGLVPVIYDNIIFFGSSTTDRSFSSAEAKTDMSSMLADYGLNPSVIASAFSGSNAQYQNSTLMPGTIAANQGLTNTLLFCQAATNSILSAYSTTPQNELDSLSANQGGIITQANSEGWDVICSNFNITPNNEVREIPLWNSQFLRPIVENLAQKSISNSDFIQDYFSLSLDNYALLSDDDTHLKEVSGDRIYRQYSAMKLASVQGKKPNNNLSGRRFVVSWGGVNAASWVNYNKINPMQSSSGGSSTNTGLSCTAHIKDADTGELLDGVIVYVKGQQGLSSTQGRGNTGNATSTVFNDKACKGYVYHDTTYPDGFEIGITTLDGRALPSAKVTISASRNTTGTDRKGSWTCGGETKLLDAVTIPCGTAIFNSVTPVNNIIKAIGVMAAGSAFSYVSAIDVQFD